MSSTFSTGQTAVIFGAGNIGRGFIGQLYSESGYEVVFVDVDDTLIDAINSRGQYTIRLEDNDGAQEINVSPVRALHAQHDQQAIADVVRHSAIGATAVGVRVLPHIAPLLAGGITQRAVSGVPAPLNLIICENLKGAAATFRGMVGEHVAAEYQTYFESHVGFVDTVIGRMVPPLTPELRAQDPSLIVVEPYKELPVDRAGFAGDIPRIVGMQPCDNFAAYTARKLYIHNCGHAVLGYLGYLAGYEYGFQALADGEIRVQVEQALAESKMGVVCAYGVEADWLDEHIADLLHRFGNRALGDTNFRLGRDPLRKLGPADRLVSPARLAEQAGVRPEALSLGIAAGYCFDHPEDSLAGELQQRIERNGLAIVMAEVSEIQPDEPLGKLVLAQYDSLKTKKY
jgi:mannitol-1-phosphate 5-dehydrogenase